jgi:ATP/ADP translocase
MTVCWARLNLFTWGLAAMACDTRQAKRLFPLFSAAGILGLVAGGLATRPLVAWVGTENLLLAWAASFLLAFALAQAIARFDARPGRVAPRESVPLLEGVRQGYWAARRSPVLRRMALAAVLFAVLYYSVVFPFSSAVATEFPGEDDLAAFLGSSRAYAWVRRCWLALPGG